MAMLRYSAFRPRLSTALPHQQQTLIDSQRKGNESLPWAVHDCAEINGLMAQVSDSHCNQSASSYNLLANGMWWGSPYKAGGLDLAQRPCFDGCFLE